MTRSFRLHLTLVLFGCTLIALLAPPALRADTVVLKNGDRLSGTAVKLEGGKLTFKTAYADAIAIAWDQVASLALAQPLVLTAAQRTLSVTSIERSSAGLMMAASTGAVTLNPTAVTALRTTADQRAYEASLHPNWGHAWSGAANVNLALARGNSDTATFGAGLTLARATRTDKTLLYFNTLYSHDGHADLTTANTTSGGLRYDHNLKPKLFVFGSGDFISNALQNLDLRSIIGGGFGWHASKTPRQTFDVMGGLVWTHESYSPSPTNSFAAIDLGEQFTRKLGAASLFTEQAYFYPDLQDAGQYQFVFNTSFSTKLAKVLSWQTAFSDQYTSFPPAGTLNNDVILTTGLGVTLTRH